MSSTPRREFLLLADTFKADKHDPVGMIGSEKLDGNRVFWDGGVSRGDDTVNVPWASIYHPKTGKLKAKIKPKATGLWSRFGNVVMAPDWFLDQLPPVPSDGELYAGRGNFQLTQTIVRRDDPNAGDWSKIKFIAFAAPTYEQVFQDGLIKNPNFLREIRWSECVRYVRKRGFEYDFNGYPPTYRKELETLGYLKSYADHTNNTVFDVVHTAPIHSMEQLDIWTKQVCANGGEGVMVRDPDSVWYPKRRPFILKCKPRPDAEATIVGFVAGKKGKTGQFLGKLGTLQCVWYGDETAKCGLLKAPVSFEVGTGLTHADRELGCPLMYDIAKDNPGKPIPGACETKHFKIGDRITFSYMGLTDKNSPREPAFLRVRGEDE